jgi:hypothetical protein
MARFGVGRTVGYPGLRALVDRDSLARPRAGPNAAGTAGLSSVDPTRAPRPWRSHLRDGARAVGAFYGAVAASPPPAFRLATTQPRCRAGADLGSWGASRPPHPCRGGGERSAAPQGGALSVSGIELAVHRGRSFVGNRDPRRPFRPKRHASRVQPSGSVSRNDLRMIEGAAVVTARDRSVVAWIAVIGAARAHDIVRPLRLSGRRLAALGELDDARAQAAGAGARNAVSTSRCGCAVTRLRFPVPFRSARARRPSAASALTLSGRSRPRRSAPASTSWRWRRRGSARRAPRHLCGTGTSRRPGARRG